MRKVFFLLLTITLSSTASWAQPVTASAYGALIEAAELSLENKDYYNALVKFEEAYDDRKDKSLLSIIADLKLKIRDYAGARRDFRSAIRDDKKGEMEELRYKYGQALMMDGRYEEAQEEFEYFLATNPGDSLRSLTQNALTGIAMATAYEDDGKEEFKPNHLGRKVNGPDSEYGPTYGRDGSLYFASFKTDDVIFVGVSSEGEGENEEPKRAQIYRSVADDDGDWQEPEALDVKINRPGYHTSNVAFSDDGRRMYFTRARLQGNTLKESKIYYAEGSDADWGAPQECIGVNGDWIANYPAAGALFGREVLFFSAKIEGGYGGYDLYYATYKDGGVYGEPVNLGPTVNTPGDEITPHYFDGTLYFSSNGLAGFGGFDIFFSSWDGARWSDPTNVGGRYNTAQDEQYFSLDADGYQGFFTSNRTGGSTRSIEARTCCDDIYSFQLEQLEAKLVVGLFTEDKQPLPGGTVRLKNTIMNTNKSQAQPEVNRFDFPLDLEMTYEITASREGYYPETAEVSTVDLEASQEFVRRLYLTKIPAPQEIIVYDTVTVFDTVTIEKAFVLENILYDFNDDKILPAAEPDLQILLDLLNDTEGLVIELSSHTDYRGSDSYNQRLSQRRANSAKRWLVERGIAGNRVVAKGYGESLPQTISTRIADRHDFLSVGDVLIPAFIDSLETEEQIEAAHQINRRTEFKIVEGPTFIPVPRTEVRKRTEIIQPPAQKPGTEPQGGEGTTQVEIDERSSLFGQKDISGLPVLVFQERSVDFGAVKKGEKREYTYEFTNRGETEAVIGVISACDCTTSTYDKSKIQPGETAEIKVVFDSSDKEEAETIVIDIFLENKDKDGYPIVEKVAYMFTIE